MRSRSMLRGLCSKCGGDHTGTVHRSAVLKNFGVSAELVSPHLTLARH
jgi:DNA polymerase II large subunit